MARRKDLQRWQAAGLISAEQVEAISTYENEAQAKRPWMLYSLITLGAFSIGIGLIAVVASNWDEIGMYAKLGVDLAVGVGLALGARRAIEREQRLARETLILLLYGWTLASIALVAQIYQLGGNPAIALLVWSFATAPLFVHARTMFTGVLWMIGLTYAYELAIFELVLKPLEHRGDDGIAITVAAAAFIGLPFLAMMATWSSTRIAERRPAISASAGALAGLVGAFLVVSVPQLFYVHQSADDAARMRPALGVVTVLMLVVAFLARRVVRRISETWLPQLERLAAAFPIALTLIAIGALCVPHDHLGFASALTFIVLFVGVAALGSLIGVRWITRMATAIIALRILIVYFEVFGSLAATGVGLIFGGLLSLFLGWAWTKSRHMFGESP